MGKGIITLLEMIGSIIVLIVSFNIFFPGFKYQSKWPEVTLLIQSRDLLLTLDRANLLYSYSFNDTAFIEFSQQFLDPNLVVYMETQNFIKSEIIVACNCSNEQIRNLSLALGKIKINNRTIFISFIPARNLYEIPQSDALIIWGYVQLNPYYDQIYNYLKSGNGIIELMNFPDQNSIDTDNVQKNLFGLQYSGLGNIKTVNFNSTPLNTTDPIYGPYRMFHSLPVPVAVYFAESIGCILDPSPKGFLKLNQTDYSFWICTSDSIKIDNNADGSYDYEVKVGEVFNISTSKYNFTLNYVEKDSIGVSFEKNFVFSNFTNTYSFAAPKPYYNYMNRTLLKTVSSGLEYPICIINTNSSTRTAWLPEISLESFDHEKRQLLLSLIIWASNKEAYTPMVGRVKKGYFTSYINVVNDDLFEIYKFNLGLLYPY